LKYTDVSEDRAAYIIALMTEAIFQKAVTFILAAVRT
jgi:hypothetical protein